MLDLLRGTSGPGAPHPPARPDTRPRAAVASSIAAIGLLVLAGGYAAGWEGRSGWAVAGWYVGMTVIVAPYGWLLLSPHTRRRDRSVGAVSLGVALYLAWLLASPVLSVAYDESLHVTTLLGMLSDGWFPTNSVLPVSPHYPGLELATGAVHWLTGLPLMACEVVVVLLARSSLVLGLYLLAERLGGPRAGGIAALLYCASSQFYFFNAQFSYQTVALAALIGALVFLLRACDSSQRQPLVPMVCAQACLGALAVTHHLTSWIALGGLWCLAFFFWAGAERRRARLTLLTAEMGTLVVLCWSVVVAPLLVRYLGPIFDTATTELAGLIELDGGGRQVLSGSGADATPQWQTLVMLGAVLLWCLLLVPAAWSTFQRRAIGGSSSRLVPLLVAASYPALLLTRFSPSAAEVGERATSFVAIALALLIGAWLAPRLHRVPLLLAVPAVTVLVLGGAMLGGGPDWQRVPGPYIAGAEQRSIDSETVAAAQWAGRYLPEGSRVAADATMARVLPNFAPVDPVSTSSSSVNVTELFLPEQVGDDTVRLIQDADIDFLVVDTRMIDQTVQSGAYFDGSEGYGEQATRFSRQQLEKFDGAAGFSLVLDGPVQVYDVRALTGTQRSFADRPDPGIPGDFDRWQMLLAGLAIVGSLVLVLARSGALPWTARRVAGPLLLTLPTLMALGAFATTLGYPPWLGSATMLGTVAWSLRRIGVRRSTLTSRAEAAWPRISPELIFTACLVVLAATLACTAAYHGLFGGAELPPPVTGEGG